MLCCLYPTGDETLAEAETLALEATVERADLKGGQPILELACGWGSLSLFMAERFSSARVTAVSNSTSQRRYIEHAATQRRLTNLSVITADMNAFEPGQVYDRVVSVEMFEHMSDWSECWLSRSIAIGAGAASTTRQPRWTGLTISMQTGP